MSDEESTEEVEVEEVAPAAAPQKPEQAPVVSFYDALLVHKRAVDEKFPQASEAEKTMMVVACLDAQMSVLHANTIARALALPDRETLAEALQDLQQRYAALLDQHTKTTKAYANIQRQLQGLDRRR